MIQLTKYNGKSLVLNADWIQTVEATPDTVITLTTGKKLIVKEGVEEVVAAYKQYKKQILDTVSMKRGNL